MPALQLIDSRMQSSPHCTHFNIHQGSHGCFPLSSPTSPISYDNSSTSPIVTHTDEDRPPDVHCTLRFGDIPASSFGTGARSGFMQSPASLHLLGSSLTPADSGCIAKGEVKLLHRSQSKLGKQSSLPMRGIEKDLEGLGSDGVPVTTPAHAEAPCCTGASGSCSSVNCLVSSPGLSEAFLTLQKFPDSSLGDDEEGEEIWSGAESWPVLDVYSCDDFRMYEFKVRKCVRGRSHDWTECPFAHPGEKARRRDPRRYHYSGTACPDFRKGNCRKGEACEYSHGVFECWLHPTRYRTQPCKDGKECRRRVCFFAHTPEQLRVVPAEGESPPTTPGSSNGGSARSSLLKAAALSGGAYDGSPFRRALSGTLDGQVALELFLDDAASKSAPAGACNHHHHHHWIGIRSSQSSTLVGLSAGATSPSPSSSPILSPASSLVSSGIPAHRRHLDRLHSIPTLSIPSADDATGSPPRGSPCSMADLMSTLQSLQISPSAMTVQSCRTLSSASSAWPRLSQLQQAPSQLSLPNTPKSRYTHPVNMVQINSTERATVSPYAMKLAVAETAGSSTSAATVVVPEMQQVVESEVPDLGWVNDLVQ